jgi:hypothetical protein
VLHLKSVIHLDDVLRPFISSLLAAGLIMMVSFPAMAQEQDTSAADTTARFHSPRKAVALSAICPGLGQVYNKKYWKLPIIYGAGGAFAYFAGYYQLKYKKFRDANAAGNTGEPVFIDGNYYDYEDLERGMNYYRRYRDLDILGVAAIYLLNVIDAMVDAHFFYYDVSDKLTMKVKPALIENQRMTAAIGIQINLGF